MRGVERGEDNFGRALRRGRGDGHFCDAGGDRSFETPAGGFGVGAAFGAVGGGEPRDLEPGVVFERLNETLTDDAGGTEDSYR